MPDDLAAGITASTGSVPVNEPLRARRHGYEHQDAEAALREQVRLAGLRAHISAALVSGESLPAVLQLCTEALVKNLDVAFARIWTLNEPENTLELQASAGLYTHLNGRHGRVRVGDFKIGRIAQSAQPLLTNDVPHDPNISDPEWARKEGMVAFAGYPMILDGRVLGVMAAFARHALSETVLDELAFVADGIAQWIRRKRAEDSLRESEQRFRIVADAAPVLIWMSGPAKLRTYFNKGWLDFVGRTMEQELGNGWTENIHPDDFDRCMHTYTTSFDARRPFGMEYRLRHHSGQYRWILGRGVPRFGADETFEGYIGSCVDIHDGKEAADSVRQAGERLHFMAESMPQKIFTARSNGDVDYLNRLWLEFTGLSFEQIRNWGWTQFIHPDDVEENVRRWRRAVDTGEPFQFEHRFRRADGVYRWHLSRAHAMRDAQGKSIMWIGSSTDIDDQKQAEQMLEKRVEERTASVRQLSLRLLTLQDEEHRSISRELHDSIGQHLASAKMGIERLQQLKSFGNEIELLSDLSATLTHCMSETRTISYLLHPPLIDELGFPAAARWYVQGFSERSGIKVNLELASDSGRLPRTVELPLFRVLQASLSNVHRHAQSPSVDVRFDVNAAEARLEVRDYGRGISHVLLERFNATGAGSGIGLAGMRERMRELEGRLEIESDSNGTVVRAVIPISAIANAEIFETAAGNSSVE